MATTLGRSPADAGSDQSAKPEPISVVSALRATVPNADTYRLEKVDFDARLVTLQALSQRRIGYASGNYVVLPQDDMTALFEAAAEPIEALRALEPYLDAIVCYASTMSEHEPNRLAANARTALANLKVISA